MRRGGQLDILRRGRHNSPGNGGKVRASQDELKLNLHRIFTPMLAALSWMFG